MKPPSLPPIVPFRSKSVEGYRSASASSHGRATTLPAAALTALLALLALLSASGAAAENSWKTGPELRRQMQAVIGISWPENPLRDSLDRLATDQQVAMLLDRNVDPGLKIEIVERGATLEQTLENLALRSKLAVCYLGPVVYFAPQEVAARTGVLAAIREEEAASLPAPVAARLALRRAVKWETLAEPRALIEQTAAEYGLRVTGLERVPHDLWRAAELPPLNCAERMTLLLAGFQLTFRWSGGGTAIELIGVDDAAAVERSYDVPGDAAKAMAELRRKFPKAGVRRVPRGVRVTATFAEHFDIDRALRGAKAGEAVAVKPPPVAGATTYTLEIENTPASAVLGAIAKQHGWELRVDPQAQEAIRGLVSFNVKDVSLDELMSKTLDSLGLSYRAAEGKLEVFPKP